MRLTKIFSVITLFFCLLTGAAAQETINSLSKSDETGRIAALAAYSQRQKAVVAEGVRTTNFGFSVAISGTTAVVGSPLDDAGANMDQGAAFVFVRSSGTWTLQARLEAQDARANDLFGSSVAISGETIVVGATKSDGTATDSGAAYVFTRDGSAWTQQAKLSANDGATGDNFGFSAAINGNTVAIGANLDDANGGASGFDRGSAYIFVRSGTVWTQQAQVVDSQAVSQMFFGCALALNGENLIVGANGNSGFALIFSRSGTAWTLQTRFQSDDIAAMDNFGSAVGISGDVLTVGSPAADVNDNADQGAVYVFQRIVQTNTILQTQKLAAAEAAANDRFGSSLGFDGTSIIVGAGLDDVGANADQGSALVFTRNAAMLFAQQTQLFAADGAANDNFGNSVAIAGNLAIGGAFLDDVDPRVDQGSAQAFFRNANNTWAQPQVLTASDPAQNAAFGYSTSISGATAVVGAPFETVGANVSQGALYVYTKSRAGWSRQAKLLDLAGAQGDALGYRVAISGDTIVAGAFSADGANPDVGAVYVFVRSGATWTQQAKLFASDGSPFDAFGASVAIAGDTIIGGATSADINGNDRQGAAYVFTRSGATWTQQAKLSASDGAPEDGFGWSAALQGSTAVVGAITDDTDDRDGQGSAYVFSNESGIWTQTQKITMNDPQSATAFGASVSLDGDSIAVGAFFTRVGINSTQGAAYVFTRNAGVWTEQAKLLASDGTDGDYFGSIVDLDGNNLLVSATYDDFGANTNQGSVYLFERTGATWTQRQKLMAADGAPFDSFGLAAALDGANIVVGAPDADVNNPNNLADESRAASVNQGAIYFYSNAAATAATAVLGGRCVTAQGRPIKNVRVVLSGDNLFAPRTAITNSFGRYRFESLPTGATYIVSAAGKRFAFGEPAQAINLTGDENAVDFVAVP